MPKSIIDFIKTINMNYFIFQRIGNTHSYCSLIESVIKVLLINGVDIPTDFCIKDVKWWKKKSINKNYTIEKKIF